jgi:hypothetical protein
MEALGQFLYATTYDGGNNNGGVGTVFAINIDGTGFTVLHCFTMPGQMPSPIGTVNTNSDGIWPNPSAPLVVSRDTLFGTATEGGAADSGTVFSISLPVRPPLLAISSAGASVILTWATNAIGFTLQSATNLASPVWTTNLPAPVVVNGQYTVTNPISGTQQFFRLTQ